MSEILAKMADSTARQLEERAAKATDPVKRDKLLAKAAKQRLEAEGYRRPRRSAPTPPRALRPGPMQGTGAPLPAPGPGPGAPPAGMNPMDAPTHQLRPVQRGVGPAVPPSPQHGFIPAQGAPLPEPAQPGTAPMPRAKKIGIGVVAVFALIGAASVFGNGDAAQDGFDAATAPPAPSAAAPVASGPDPADVRACQRAGEVMEAWAPAAQGLSTGETDLPELARETRTAMDGMSEVPIIANDPGVTAASRVLTGQHEMIAAAAGRGDLSNLATLAGDGAGMVDDLVSACRSAASA